MNPRSKKEIERLDALFKQLGATEELPVIGGLKEAKMLAEAQRDDGELPFSEQCQKLIYPSEARARRVIRNRQKGGAGRLRCYWCEQCRGYHLTKNT